VRSAFEAAVPSTVARKRVTAHERQLVVRILAYWHAKTEVRVRAPDVGRGIVGRLREYPELQPEDHRGLIDANLRRPWWEGTATPQVLYGNGVAFEAALARWRGGRGSGDYGGRDPGKAPSEAEQQAAIDRALAESEKWSQGNG
jgi:hypothetical protein